MASRCSGRVLSPSWPRLASAAALVAATAVAPVAQAAPHDTLRPSAHTSAYVTTESSAVLPAWTPSARLLTGYEYAPAPDPTLGLQHRATTYFVAGLGLFNHVELGLGMPYVVYQRGDGVGDSPLNVSGAGDLRINGKGTILSPRRRGFGLGISADVLAPTSRGNTAVSAGGVGFLPQVLLEQRMGAASSIALNIGYALRQDTTFGDIAVGDSVTYRLGARIPFGAQRRVAMLAEIDGGISVVRDGKHNVGLRAGIQWRSKSGLALEAYGGGSPSTIIGTTEALALVSIGYAPGGRMAEKAAFAMSPRPKATEVARFHDAWKPAPAPAAPANDMDRDGVLVELDLCPNVAEDLDGFEDTDGCPDFDNDGDRIADRIDLCVDAPELVNGYNDNDGCPDRRTTHGGKTFATFDPARLVPALRFESGRNALRQGEDKKLQELAELLRLNPWLDHLEIGITVEASADPVRDRALAQARGELLREKLAALGVADHRIDFAAPRAVPAGAEAPTMLALALSPKPESDASMPEAEAVELPATTDRLLAEARERAGQPEAEKTLEAQGPDEDAAPASEESTHSKDKPKTTRDDGKAPASTKQTAASPQKS